MHVITNSALELMYDSLRPELDLLVDSHSWITSSAQVYVLNGMCMLSLA